VLKVVLDTNVLVSALWTQAGNCSAILSQVLQDELIPCFDHNILNEYRVVLSRPRLVFSSAQTDELLREIASRGLAVTVSPSTFPLPDEADRKFYDTAKACDAILITGNIRHFPKDPLVMTPAQFLARKK
jgi:putative PIN family toxin of toxin-antitoxin system